MVGYGQLLAGTCGTRSQSGWYRGLIRLTTAALLLIAVMACSFYRPAEYPYPPYQQPQDSDTARVATIRGSEIVTAWIYANQHVDVVLIDGQQPKDVDWQSPIKILTGIHDITLRFTQAELFAFATFTVYLEDGRSYIGRFEVITRGLWPLKGDKVRFWIEDMETGTAVVPYPTCPPPDTTASRSDLVPTKSG